MKYFLTILSLSLIFATYSTLNAQPGATRDILGAELERLAEDTKMDKQAKFFAVTDVYLIAVKEALKADTDKEFTRMLNVFEFKNQVHIAKIFEELDLWQESMSQEEKMALNIAFVSREGGSDFFIHMMQVRNRAGEDEVFMRKFEKLYPLGLE
jgi:hypothetical protein